MPEKIVLAYSGGLDTSVAAHWLCDQRGYEVHCLTIDLGNLGVDRSGPERTWSQRRAGTGAHRRPRGRAPAPQRRSAQRPPVP